MSFRRIVGIPGSSSKQSINKQLTEYAVSGLLSESALVLDLNDFAMPIYSFHHEKECGVPPQAQTFLDSIASADLLVVSLAEHNGSYTSWFKNIIDWSSRITKDVFGGKPMLLLSTSPGGRGGQSVLNAAESYFPFMGADIKGTLSIPFFNKAFQNGKLNEEWQSKLDDLFMTLK